jgi:hypothetical protein
MAKRLPEILGMNWQGQAEFLRGMSRKELDLLWFDLQEFRDRFDNLYLAVFSVLRDRYESENGNSGR